MVRQAEPRVSVSESQRLAGEDDEGFYFYFFYKKR
jgi:hypothetical protein